jgi:hypothetical protein
MNLLYLKLATGLLAIMAIAVFAMDPTIKVAIIVSIPPTLAAIVTGMVNHSKLSTIEINTNHRLDMLLAERNNATSRADRAEGEIKGAAGDKKNS